MSKKFNLNDSIKNKKHFNNSEDATFDKLMIAVQKDDVDLVRINFEIEKNLRQKLKSKVSAEGRQIKDVLIELIKNYLIIQLPRNYFHPIMILTVLQMNLNNTIKPRQISREEKKYMIMLCCVN